MFKQYIYLQYTGQNEHLEHEFSYYMIDSEFSFMGTGPSIIKVYEDRGLNVAANLALEIAFFTRNCNILLNAKKQFDIPEYSIEDIISFERAFYKGFDKYETDVRKMLILV